jgi:hypothetical protein
MAAPDIVVVKTWCRIDGTEFDTLLPPMIAHATALASHETGIDYTTTDMPDGVLMWCCAQVAHWIANPAATVSPSGNNPQKNLFLDSLLDPHRVFAMEVLPVVV